MCERCSSDNFSLGAQRLGRRAFFKLISAASVAVAELGTPGRGCADGKYSNIKALKTSMGVERIARLSPVGYQSTVMTSDLTIKWVQVDLERAQQIDCVKLFPLLLGYSFGGQCFPRRFRLEAANDDQFQTVTVIIDHTKTDYPPPGDKVVSFPATKVTARYVRFTATILRNKQLSLSKLEVWSGNRDAAEGCAILDSDTMEASQANYRAVPVPLAHGNGPDQAEYEMLRTVYPTMPAYATIGRMFGIVSTLTRKPRPQGEGVVTDNPDNVIPADQWKPASFKASVPRTGVKIGPGLFRTVMENNIEYLLKSFSVGELLRPFRTRAGKPNPPGLPPPVPFWDTDLPGSNAGRFMMGAGTTLRWIEHSELRHRLNEIVAGIAECQRPDGYAMGYPEDTIFYSERAPYTRSWVTHGLVEAGYAGNQTAFKILRRFYDWFDQCAYLPELLRRPGQGVQGMIANTRTYFTPIGQPKDIQVMQRYFQENYWLEMLSRRDTEAIWKYPYDHPHCYLLTSITPYLDQYRATGDKKYLDAVMGGWDLYHNNWQHTGGAISICEQFEYPPKSAFLNLRNGENCGSSFWVSLNHGLHQLFPDEEKYANEIEKSIYNVLIADQDGSVGIRYHANLNGKKEFATAKNTCCEGQGTRQLGALPEYIYSIAGDGLYVNHFAPSNISWRQNGYLLGLEMETDFPFQPAVSLRLSTVKPAQANIRVRIPTWAAADMPIYINGALAATGKPGAYQALDRTWADGDTIAFTLPINFQLSLYTGVDQSPKGLRYALEYGPILMAAVSTDIADAIGMPPSSATAKERAFAKSLSRGTVEAEPDAAAWPVDLLVTADEITRRLKPVPDHPLHFSIDGVPEYQFVPYWQIDEESFTCFPTLKTPASYPREAVEAEDFALASKGAIATSDSELSSQPGCTAKIIDGIIASPSDFAENSWHSAVDRPHPHWVQVKLPKSRRIGRVVIDFADPLGHPTSFQGMVRVNGEDKVVFDVANYHGWRKYAADIKPVETDSFRLVIRDSASPLHPNAAQISQIELYPPKG